MKYIKLYFAVFLAVLFILPIGVPALALTSSPAPTCKVNIIYVEQSTGKTLSTLPPLTGQVGAHYAESVRHYPGYTCLSTSENTSGYFTLAEQTASFFFKQNDGTELKPDGNKHSVTAKYVEKSTNKELFQEQVVEAGLGELYGLGARDLTYKGYRCIGNTTNSSGIFTLLPKTATFYYELIPPPADNGIKIKKIDSATSLPLAGVEFLISQSKTFDVPNYKITTNGEGIAQKSGIPIGTWYIKETAAPINYMPITDPITVSVGTGVTELTIKNTPYSLIKILKVDEDNVPVAGAKFSIYAGTDITKAPLYSNLTTNSSGIFLQGNLTAGEYTVVETEAPAGYVKDPNPVTVTLLLGKTSQVKFTNNIIRGTMHILKYDAVSKEQLAGAEFTVYSDVNLANAVATTTSLANAPSVIDLLKPGTYYVKETKVPAGYLIDPTVKSVVIEYGKTTVVEFFNTRGVPTAGNYATILIVGTALIGVCTLGWLAVLIAKKRKNK
ncbi:MAG: SpaA isopeptide-forming pilin-related protein [Oscillospiraceae bacterium]